jgi:hypothetical protein
VLGELKLSEIVVENPVCLYTFLEDLSVEYMFPAYRATPFGSLLGELKLSAIELENPVCL